MQIFFHDLFVRFDDLLVVIMYLSPLLITKPIDVLLQTNWKFFIILNILLLTLGSWQNVKCKGPWGWKCV